MPTLQTEHGARFFPTVSGRRRAIVIGGGIAGLLACRVLADHFDQIILLERDKYPDGAELRAGTPQSQHVHLLLLRGKQILEELFPGLQQELIDNGAETVKMGEELRVLTYHGWRVKYSGGLSLLTFTRPLLEHYLRRRLRRIQNISILDECRVSGLIAEEQDRRVSGVRCRFKEAPHKEVSLLGKLTADASGRFSRSPEWLQTIGYPRPQETIVDSFLGYASRLYERPEKSAIPRALLLLGRPPDHSRGGVLLPVEGRRWHVTLVGIGKDYPPNTETGFLGFARTLRSNILYEAIKDARPLTPVKGYRATQNRRRYYEKLPRWPQGFVVLGDALCAFNPVYAQGMTVAAMEASLLRQCLRDKKKWGRGGSNVAVMFQRKVADVIRIPWLMATTEDGRWPATTGGPSGSTTRLMHHYLDTVIALATKYPEVDYHFARVVHLIEPAYMLFHPRIARRVLAQLIHC